MRKMQLWAYFKGSEFYIKEMSPKLRLEWNLKLRYSTKACIFCPFLYIRPHFISLFLCLPCSSNTPPPPTPFPKHDRVFQKSFSPKGLWKYCFPTTFIWQIHNPLTPFRSQFRGLFKEFFLDYPRLSASLTIQN